jgi:putative oxidoreductase
MNILLWVLQVLLALVFLAHGLLVLMPPPDIAAQMTAALPRWFWVFLGVAEVAAAIGITLPGATRIRPGLVTAAAAGITLVMVCATIWHVVRGEISSAFITLVLLIMATVVTYMRWRVKPIAARVPA